MKRNILVLDIGGSHVKAIVSGAPARRKFPSGLQMTPKKLIAAVKKITGDWTYDVVSIGFPAPAVYGKIAVDPKNLGKGWVGFDFEKAFGKPVRILNDAAMQALGSYEGGRMLFLGLGTGLGSALISENVLVPLELGELTYSKTATIEDVLGKKGLKRIGPARWEKAVQAAVKNLKKAFVADYVVLGGGNAKKLKKLPDGARAGDNQNAFIGGERLWEMPEHSPKDGALIIA